jgi:two-component system response regulator YesN
VKSFCLEVAFLVLQAVRRLKQVSVKAPFVNVPDLVHEEVRDLSTFEQVKQWLLARVGRFAEEAEARRHPYSEPVRKVCAYMKATYTEGISLQQAADVVHLNKTYLSELFKKETGISFNHYLTQLRIERAKELIAAGGVTIGVLAEQVGYPDGSYLTKVFKKMTGMTPNEFKHYN